MNRKTRLFCLTVAICLLQAVFVIPGFAGELKSRAAVAMDPVTGRVLYAKNGDMRLMPASTTKLMTALVVLENAHNLADVVTISKNAALTPATKVGFRAGDKVTIEALLYAALMKSANDAAVALAEGVAGSEEQFVVLMNRKAIGIGAKDTKFINPNGLPGPGQYTTANDLSKIMRQAIRYPIIREILSTRVTEFSTEAGKNVFIRNTNRLLWSDEELIGGKTGYTKKARHCYVCIGDRDDQSIIVSILGAPSREVLWKEAEELMDLGSTVLSSNEKPVIYMTNVAADGAKARKVALTVDEGPADDREVKSFKKAGKGSAKKKNVRLASKKKGRTKAIAKSHSKKGVKYAAKKKKGQKLAAADRKVKKTHLVKKDEDGSQG